MAFPFETVLKLMAVLLLWGYPLSCLCTPPLFHRCLQHDHEALLSFKTTFNDSQGLLTSWVTGTDCCTWHGVTCDNLTNHVVRMALQGNFSSKSELHYGSLHGGVISDSVCNISYLKSLDLSDNGLRGTIPPCLGNLSHLQHLHLDSNDLSGRIPPSLCSVTNLTHLSLPFNQLSGSIPVCLGYRSSLQYIDVFSNQLSGNIPFSLGNLSSLRFFAVAKNNLSGTIPSSFAKLSCLSALYAGRNAFNESISPSFLPSSLEQLGLSFSHNEVISETFFNNLTSLNRVYFLNCVFNISMSWIPSFQLSVIYLVSCKMNSQVPLWISTQYSVQKLVLVGNNIFGEIPSWIWETSPCLSYVNLSRNQLEGNIIANTSIWISPPWHSNIIYLVLNDNLLSGNIPPVLASLSKLQMLDLSNNNFTGSIPHVLGTLSKLQVLNLANNNITGNIPSSLASCSELKVVNLGNNSLEGRIPHAFGELSQLHSLVLHYNKLEGTFPNSITNCTNLQLFDVGHNSLEGRIPKSIRHLSALRVLHLRENHFGGSIPSEIGHLMQLQIMDLSSNDFSGSIPHNISCLKAMSIPSTEGFVLSNELLYSDTIVSYQYELDMNSKGVYLHYMYILSTLTVIDLSNNRISGEVPSDLGDLKGLRQLNLSMNNLSSSIPNSLGEMKQLESLDLSANRFFGKIPSELDSLNFLGVLNLFNNNLSGSIPQGAKLNTFPESSYAGNPYLWGCPLARNCSWPQYVSSPPTFKILAKGTKIPWYGIALGLSYGAGFGGTLTVIAAIFYQKYFEVVDMFLKLLFPWLNNRIV